MRFAWGLQGHGSGERKSAALQKLDFVAVRCLLGFFFRKAMLKH